jgi:cell division FtsZ-interacting protein ZapD
MKEYSPGAVLAANADDLLRSGSDSLRAKAPAPNGSCEAKTPVIDYWQHNQDEQNLKPFERN